MHVEANLFGVNLGSGWGQEDIVSDFTIGRSQIVQADVNSHRMIVLVDGAITKNYPVSYGKDAVTGRDTVSGIHVVTEKFPTFSMCNPEFDYCNVEEKWAVRINNNGEFIHENALTTPYLGKENVSHGCVNMGVGDAEDYYNSAIYGDPVDVTNTGAPMTREGRPLRLDLLLRGLAEALRAVALRSSFASGTLANDHGKTFGRRRTDTKRCTSMHRSGSADWRRSRCTPRRWRNRAPVTPAG